jgi:hypothetical protein
MSGKSIEEILEKMMLQKQEQKEKELKLEKEENEKRENARQEYLRRNKMYENLSFNPTSNSASAGGKSKGGVLSKSYITNDITYLYTQTTLDKVLDENPELYNYNFDNKIFFDDVSQLYSFYSNIFMESGVENPGGYTLGIGTQLKEIGPNLVFNVKIGVDDVRILEWVKVKQLTSQSELGGTSPDDTEAYVLIYSDWNEDYLLDMSSEQSSINILLDGTNWDYRTLDDGPLI